MFLLYHQKLSTIIPSLEILIIFFFLFLLSYSRMIQRFHSFISSFLVYYILCIHKNSPTIFISMTFRNPLALAIHIVSIAQKDPFLIYKNKENNKKKIYKK